MFAGSGPSNGGGAESESSVAEGMAGRRSEENKATKNKMAALQKQLKEKRSGPMQSPPRLISSSSHSQTAAQLALINRQAGQCCASNLQKSILSE